MYDICRELHWFVDGLMLVLVALLRAWTRRLVLSWDAGAFVLFGSPSHGATMTMVFCWLQTPGVPARWKREPRRLVVRRWRLQVAIRRGGASHFYGTRCF